MQNITATGLCLIKYYEGFRANSYICAAGYRTIGYGHVILPCESIKEPLSEEAAEKLLRKDVIVAQKSVLRNIKVPLFDHQFDALVSFTFNLGAAALQRSTLRRKINREEHVDVPEEVFVSFSIFYPYLYSFQL